MEAIGAFGKEVEWRDALAGHETLGAPFHATEGKVPPKEKAEQMARPRRRIPGFGQRFRRTGGKKTSRPSDVD